MVVPEGLPVVQEDREKNSTTSSTVCRMVARPWFGSRQPQEGQLFQGTFHDGRSFREGHPPLVALYAEAAKGAFEPLKVDEHVVLPRGRLGGNRTACGGVGR